MKVIECCHHCVPPKRHEGCHSHCPEYIEERDAYTAERDAIRQKRKESDAVAIVSHRVSRGRLSKRK